VNDRSTHRGRIVASGALACVAVAVTLLAADSGGGWTVSATVPDASYIVAGSPVRIAGQPVGAVSSVRATRTGVARIVLRIDDHGVWPLPAGTRLVLRWMSTIAYDGRYAELDLPAGRGGATISDGGIIPSADAAVPVEFDQVFSTFGQATRRNLGATLDRSGAALSAAAPDFSRALYAAPSALAQGQAVLSDLGVNQPALDTLVRSTDQVLAAVQAANPGVSQLISAGATTFDAVASRASDLQRTFTELAPTLAGASTTLAHADRTLSAVARLTTRLSPGVVQLQRIASPLNGTLQQLVSVGPDAVSTLAAVHRATPSLNPLLGLATSLMPTFESVGRQGAKEFACIRPYAPDVAAFASNWTGFLAYQDGQDKYARSNFPAMPYPNATPLNSAQVAGTFPFLQYHFPDPPGEIGGQPWLITSCGVGPDALNPSKDPETVH
jgi:phospholipid/cholesterol/gamma-HCH transport system substrate-binding protein